MYLYNVTNSTTTHISTNTSRIHIFTHHFGKGKKNRLEGDSLLGGTFNGTNTTFHFAPLLYLFFLSTTVYTDLAQFELR